MKKNSVIIIAVLIIAVLIMTGCVSRDKSITREVNGQNVRIEFYSPSIVRVVKAPGELPSKSSYSVILKPREGMKEKLVIKENDCSLSVSSSAVTVNLDKSTGLITFTGIDGEPLLTDASTTFNVHEGDADAGKLDVKQQFILSEDEAIFGLGQLRDTSMNQRGRDVEIWNHNTYTSIPYFTSEKGYGLYWDYAGRSRFTDNSEGAFFTSEAAVCADYYFIYGAGTQDGVIAGIRQLTGQATMFPLWAMGHWQCRERYKTSDELAAVLDKYRELQIPLDAIVQDWQYWGCDSNWNAMRFMNPYYINKVGDPQWERYLPGDMKKLEAQEEPRLKSPEEMVSYVHSQNARLMITLWPDFGPWTEQYAALEKIGALLPFETWPRHSGVKVYDVFNPEAREIYWQYLTHLYEMGFDAWWTDSTEPDHFEKPGDDDYETHDGTWRTVKNAFPLVHNRSIYEHQRAMKGNSKRSLQMTRSGALGLQHYGTFSWSGDVVASWDEMKNQIPSGLNYTLCGIPFWNTDLGGFFYWNYRQDPKNPAIQELQTRWMQWGTFMPLMRNHCSSPMKSEIYLMGEEGYWAYDVIKSYIKLRYRLLPYIYSMAGSCVQESGSMMRPFVMDFPSDKKAIRLNDEYMFGRSLLVKPVTDAMYTTLDENKWGQPVAEDVYQANGSVDVYLPQGTSWYDFWTNEKIEGGTAVSRECPIDIMPVYVRAGSIVPFGPDVQYSGEKPWDDLEIRVYPGADGSFTLYEDNGDGYDYEKGAFSTILFTWDDATSTLTIAPRSGAFKGMLKSRTFRIVLVDATSGPGHQPMQGAVPVTYTGKEIRMGKWGRSLFPSMAAKDRGNKDRPHFPKQPVPEKPRILISTDIGGTDPDDNQSMMHFLLYCNEFDCEGLVSSPSYGDGNKEEIIRMIGLYEQDLPALKKHAKGWPKADYLRSVARQGHRGASPLEGYSTPTEGSDWIVTCARKKEKRPLYLLVWGGLDDVAQALHDAPDIADNIRIHWIGGPNKKWSLPSYVYIVENFPDLWFIEDNESYRGFIADYKNPDRYNAGFYDYYVKGAGHLGADFYNYLEGKPKLGDTPSLLYMLDGDPADPTRESWGGSYEKCTHSSRAVFDRPTTSCDTVQRDGIIEWRFNGPHLRKGEGRMNNGKWSSGAENEVGVLTVDRQNWPVYYLGDGKYMARYATYKTGIISYTITSEIAGFPLQSGCFYVENVFPGRCRETDYIVGDTWWTDLSDESFYAGKANCQGAKTVEMWRKDVMEDWGKRCGWLK